MPGWRGCSKVAPSGDPAPAGNLRAAHFWARPCATRWSHAMLRVSRVVLVCFVCLVASCAGAPPEGAPVPGSVTAPAPAPVPAPPPPPPARPPERPSKREAPRERGGETRPLAPPATVGPGQATREPVVPPAPSGRGEAAPAQDTRTARERLLEGMRWLDRGEPDSARGELEAALRLDPGNEVAKSLLWQLDADPDQALGRESFPYTVQPGDSLSKISKRFLGESSKFYLLARYNGIRVPGGLEVGQVLKIPGRKPGAGPAPRPLPPPRPSAAPAPETGSGDTETEQAAERAYQSGLQALSAKSLEKAYDQFSQALKANPKHAGAAERMRQMRPALVETYYKNALSAFHKHDLDETIKYCNKALEIDPDNEKVKLRRTEALELQQRLKRLR